MSGVGTKVASLERTIADLENQLIDLDKLIAEGEGRSEFKDPEHPSYPLEISQARVRRTNCEKSLQVLRSELATAQDELRSLSDLHKTALRQRDRMAERNKTDEEKP